MKPRFNRLLAASITSLIALSSSVFAADQTWIDANVNNTWNLTELNWNPGPAIWTDGNSAIFGGTAETVTLGSAITADGLTFNSANYIITGNTLTLNGTAIVDTGANATAINSILAGSVGLMKTGSGTLTLGGANTIIGQTIISNGTLRAGNAAALGAGGAGNETIVQSGATLDINGQALSNTEIVRISGTGVGGNGALINAGAQQTIALNRVVLTADASVGGTNRFDIRGGTTPTLDLGGFTATKTGANQFSVVGGTITGGNININGGVVDIEGATTMTGTGTITIASTGTLGVFATTGLNRAITSNNGTISNLGSNSTIASNIALTGTTIVTGTTNTTFTGVFSGTGGISKTDTGNLILANANVAVAGGIGVTGGRITLDRNAAGGINLGTTAITLGTGREMVVAINTGISGGTVTMGSGSSLGLQNGNNGTGGAGFASNIVLASGTGAANAASIGGFIYGNNTNISGKISGTGDLRWRSNILGGASNSATYTAGSNTTGWAANSYTGATSFENVNLTFSLASSVAGGTVTPFGVTTNTATINGGTTARFLQTGNAGNTTIIANAINLAATNGQTTTFFREDGNLRLTGAVDISTVGTGKVVLSSKWGNATTKGLELNGTLTGSGNLTVTRAIDEQGTIHLGNNANTYSGNITVNNSGGAAGILVLDANGAGTSAAIDLASSGSHLNVNASNATIASLSGVTGSQVSARTAGQILTVNQAGNTTFAGVIGGTGITGAVNGINLVKSGAGALTLSATNSYTGTTNVNQGTLVLTGNISTSSLTTVASGATISGNGGTTGALTIEAGGFINPGSSPGIINTGDFTLTGSYNMELAGTTVGTGYDQINVSGNVSLSGALNLISSFTPTDGAMFFILNNGGSNAITGTFAGLAEGATLTDNLSTQYQITYLADYGATSFTGGNDVALMAIPEPSVALLGALGVMALFRRRR